MKKIVLKCNVCGKNITEKDKGKVESRIIENPLSCTLEGSTRIVFEHKACQPVFYDF